MTDKTYEFTYLKVVKRTLLAKDMDKASAMVKSFMHACKSLSMEVTPLSIEEVKPTKETK